MNKIYTLTAFFAFLLFSTQMNAQYCIPDYSTGTSSNDYIDGVILGSINNLATGGPNGNFYNDYTSLSTTLNFGTTYPMTINGSTYSSGENYFVYIDYNGDFDFNDANELVYQSPTSTSASQIFNFNITVPNTITSMTTVMRVVNIYDGIPPVVATPCPNSVDNSYGETEDYTVVLVGPTTGSPIPVFSSNNQNINTGNTVNFSDMSTNNPTSWSWSFPGGTPATSTAQNPSVTYNTTGAFDVTLTVTNAAGSNTLTQTNYINVTAPATSYCTPTYSTGTSSNDYINGVVLGSINNTATGGPNGNFYNDYTSMSTTLIAGSTHPMTIQGSSYSSGENYIVYIDYNGDFDFSDANEMVYQSPTSTVANQVFNFNFTVPANVTAITTRMRVVGIYDGTPPVAITPCPTAANNTYGETEDYTVILSVPVSGSPMPTFSSNTQSILTGASVNFTGSATNNPTTWSWSFPGGTPATSSQQNPIITYNTSGVYNVTLTVSNANGSNTVTQTNYITVTDPAYCTPSYSTGTSSDDYIDGVILGNINNIASGDPNGGFYNDYTNMSTNLQAGNTYQMTINGSSYASNENYLVYIDYNGDYDFDDANELVYQSPSSTVANQVFNFSFTVPANASPISTRMRVVDIYDGTPPVVATPCPNSATNTYGEAEDYTVVITPASTILPTAAFGMNANFVCEGQSVSFNNTSSDATSFIWYFLNGTPSTSTAQSPTVTFASSGVAGVLLIASNSVGVDSLSLPLTIQASPVPVITFSNNVLSTGSFSMYQWYLNGVALPNETNQSMTPTQDGTYSVEVMNAGGCSGTSIQFDVFTTGVQQRANSAAVSISPNPAHDQLTIQLADNNKASQVIVLDMLGKEVMREQVHSATHTLSVTALQNGMYLVKINQETHKFLKQ